MSMLPQSTGVQSANKPAKQSRAPSGEPLGDFIWPMEEKDFVITLQEDGWTLAMDPCNPTINSMTIFLCKPSLL